jgi:hypothetical protein
VKDAVRRRVDPLVLRRAGRKEKMKNYIKRIIYDVFMQIVNATILWVFSNYILIHLEHRLPILTWTECIVFSICVGLLTINKYKEP